MGSSMSVSNRRRAHNMRFGTRLIGLSAICLSVAARAVAADVALSNTVDGSDASVSRSEMTYSRAKEAWNGEGEILLKPDKVVDGFDMFTIGATFQDPDNAQSDLDQPSSLCVNASYLAKLNDGVFSFIGSTDEGGRRGPRVVPGTYDGKSSLTFSWDRCRYHLVYTIEKWEGGRWTSTAMTTVPPPAPFRLEGHNIQAGTDFSDVGPPEPMEFSWLQHASTLGDRLADPFASVCPRISGLLHFGKNGLFIELPWKVVPDMTPGLRRDPNNAETTLIFQTVSCRQSCLSIGRRNPNRFGQSRRCRDRDESVCDLAIDQGGSPPYPRGF